MVYCVVVGIPNVKAISSTRKMKVYTIFIFVRICHLNMRNEVKHELLHIINDDFHIDHVEFSRHGKKERTYR